MEDWEMEDWVRLTEEVGKDGSGVGSRLKIVEHPVESSMAVLEVARSDENGVVADTDRNEKEGQRK